MNDHVWVSTSPSDPTLAEGTIKTDLDPDSRQRLIEAGRLAKLGQAVDPCVFPSTAWGSLSETRPLQFPGVTPAMTFLMGFWIISEEFASILMQYDLGAGVLVPVEMLQSDRATPFPGAWYFWNVGNTKEGLNSASSMGIMPASGGKFHIVGAKDNDIKCRSSVLGGPDAWMDPALRSAIFFSRALGDDLREAGLATIEKGLGDLLMCPVE